jgi:ABC-type uncharacterized transport system permease subunit
MDDKMRTGWLVRRRYKLVQRIAAALGGLAGLAVVADSYVPLDDKSLALTRGFVGQSVALVVVGVAVPWLLAELLWRRNLWHWQ